MALPRVGGLKLDQPVEQRLRGRGVEGAWKVRGRLVEARGRLVKVRGQLVKVCGRLVESPISAASRLRLGCLSAVPHLWVERAEEEGAGGHGEEEQADGNRAHKPGRRERARQSGKSTAEARFEEDGRAGADTGGSRVVKGRREL